MVISIIILYIFTLFTWGVEIRLYSDAPYLNPELYLYDDNDWKPIND